MAQETNKEKKQMEEPKKTESKPPTPATQPVQLDDSHLEANYANFCRVTGTPEELIIDFGLNSQPMGTPSEPLIIDHRLVVNYYTAKRMIAALHMSIQRHEQAFGAIETNVRKRVVAQPRASA